MSRVSRIFGSRVAALLVAMAVVFGWTAPAVAAAPFTASFPAGTATQIIAGSETDLAFEVEGTIPRGGDVLVLAWSDAQLRMVDSFAHDVRGEPWRVKASELSKLPNGRSEIQLLSRVNGRVYVKRGLWVEKIRVNPKQYKIGFVKGAKASHLRGDNNQDPVQLSVPQLPPQGDVLVLAWHLDQNRLIESFSHVVERAPFRIAADKLEALPPGRVQLQAKLRIAGRPIAGAEHVITIGDAPKPPQVGFVNPPSRFTLGDSQGVALSLSGPMPKGFELLVQAWSEERQALVSSFTQELKAAPYSIAANKLNTLAPGRYRLQAMIRQGTEIRLTVGHTIEVVRREPELPKASFSSAPSAYVRGSGKSVTVKLDGALPADADVLVIAWSDSQKRMVDSFAQAFTRGPVTIPAAKLDALPAGLVNLQALVRYKDQVKSRTTHDIDLQEPAKPEPKVSVAFAPGTPAVHTVGAGGSIYFNVSGQLAEDEDILAIAWSNEQNNLVQGFAQAFTAAPHRIESSSLDRFPSGAVQLQLLLRKNNEVLQKVTHWVLVVRPAEQGGDQDGKDGGSGDQDQGQDGQPGDDSTGGDGKGDGKPDAGDDTSGDDGAGTERPDDSRDGIHPGVRVAGWTTFTKSSDTQVIYVSAEGNDANDGKTPATAVRTPDRGHDLLRSGSADWLLFRRGDQFDLPGDTQGAFRGWKKSGRSAKEPIVVGAYGDAHKPRPVLRSNGRGVIEVNGGQNPSFVAFVDLHFYANRRDPAHGAPGATTGEVGFVWNQEHSTDILIEGCLFEFFSSHIEAQNPWKKERGMDRLTIRRCVLRNSYATQGFSQGGYFQNLTNLTIEGCIIDHSGWEPRVAAAKRIGFNHGFYLNHGKNIRVTGNFFLRSSYGAIKVRGDVEGDVDGLLIQDNVMADEIVGVFVGGQDDDVAYVVHNTTVKGNVFTRIGGKLSNGTIDASAVSLSQVKNGLVHDNLILDAGVEDWLAPIKSGLDRHPITGITISNNISHRWPLTDTEKYIWVRHDATLKSNLCEKSPSTYMDASRSLETYARANGYSSLDRFYEALGRVSKTDWSEKLEPDRVRRYLREGFELVPAD